MSTQPHIVHNKLWWIDYTLLPWKLSVCDSCLNMLFVVWIVVNAVSAWFFHIIITIWTVDLTEIDLFIVKVFLFSNITSFTLTIFWIKGAYPFPFFFFLPL